MLGPLMFRSVRHAALADYGDIEADGHLDHLCCLPEAVGTGRGVQESLTRAGGAGTSVSG